MTIRLSTGLCNRLLDGGATGGIKGTFNTYGWINIYQGSQPSDADTGAGTALQLGMVSNLDDGVTAITFDPSALGVISKAAAQTWRFHGLSNGTAGWFRFWITGDNPANTSTSYPRLDGSFGTSGADMNGSNTNIVTNMIVTVDSFTITMPKA